MITKPPKKKRKPERTPQNKAMEAPENKAIVAPENKAARSMNRVKRK